MKPGSASPAPYGNRVEFAASRKIRERNTRTYRLAHWPVWAWVYFLLPGPLVADLFHHGGDRRTLLWLLAVVLGTGLAAWRGWLPGTEAHPYVMFFTENKPNPFYRRACYTAAWSVMIGYAAVNLTGLVVAITTGRWMMHQLYTTLFFLVLGAVMLAGAAGLLPRARPSVRYEGYERRVFYGAVWTVAVAQLVLWLLWRALPGGVMIDAAKLVMFAAVMAAVGYLAYRGYLPRTRPIVPGEPFTLD